jgi:hypothetical protein
MLDKNQELIVHVPITLSVTVRGSTDAQAKQIARKFADSLDPEGEYIEGYLSVADLPEGATIKTAILYSPSEESCEIIDRVEDEGEGEEESSENAEVTP